MSIRAPLLAVLAVGALLAAHPLRATAEGDASPSPANTPSVEVSKDGLEPIRFRWLARSTASEGTFILGVRSGRAFHPIAEIPTQPGYVEYSCDWLSDQEKSLVELRFRDRSGRERSIGFLSVHVHRWFGGGGSSLASGIGPELDDPAWFPLLSPPAAGRCTGPEAPIAAGLPNPPPTPPPRAA